MASILWWLERPYIDLHVHVGLGAAREAFEEVCHQFGLQVADEWHVHLVVDDVGDAAAERSTAATASVSSIAMTK